MRRVLNNLKIKAKNTYHSDKPLSEDKSFQSKIAQFELDLDALEMTELRGLSAMREGKSPGAESSLLKIKGTEMQQNLSELFVEAAGEYALMYPGPNGFESNAKPAGPDYAAHGLSAFLNLRKTSIYGGSNEIQKNILSKFVLGAVSYTHLTLPTKRIV